MTVFQPLAALEEYLVMLGRFPEALAANDRAVSAFGLHEAQVLIEPREDRLAVAAGLSRLPASEAFEPTREAAVIAHAIAGTGLVPRDVRVDRREAALPDGRTLEIVLFGLPAPIRTDEPFFVAHARTKGENRAHVFHLAWRRRGAVAYPIALDTGPGGSQRPGPGFGAGAPFGLAGLSSPYAAPFVAFICEQLLPLSANEPVFFGGKPLPGIGADEMLRRINDDKAAARRQSKVLLVGIAVVGLVVATSLFVLYVARSATVLFATPAAGDRTAFYTAMNRLGDKPVSPPSSPFACGAPRATGGPVSTLLDDPTGALGVPKTIRSMEGGGTEPSPYAIRGIVRSHDRTVSSQPAHTVVLDVELHRVNLLPGSPGPESTVLCAGRITAKLRTYSPDLHPAEVLDLVKHIGCRGVDAPVCARPPLNQLVLSP
jgi:hypothetical protein